MTQPTLGPFAVTGPREVADPYPLYRRYRELDPVHRVPPSAPGAPVTWHLFRYADVAAVLSSQHFGRSAAVARQGLDPVPPLIPDGRPALRDVVDNWLVFLDPPRHTRLRAVVTRYFTARIVAGLRPRIAALAGELLTAVGGRSEVDLVADFAAPLPILVISELLGVPPGRRDWFREHAVALQQANTSRRGDRHARYAAAEAAAAALAGYFQAEVAKRRRTGCDDVIGRLASDEGLTDREIVGTCIHLLTAGHETTTNLLAKAVLALSSRPDVLHDLRTMPQLLPTAVDELVRYDSPVQMVTRWAYRDETVGGRLVERGSRVVLMLGSANRDPEQYAEPDTLDIRRSVGRHLGFGMGIHYCLGAGLARAEAEIGLAALVRRLPHLALCPEPVPYADDMVFHGPSRLMVRTDAPPDAAAGHAAAVRRAG
nr:EspP-like cytochrome P450 [uncultured bacterium]